MDLNTVAVQDLTRLGVSALEMAYLWTEVALDVVPLIDDMVEEHQARGLVVADIAECWLRLDPAIREAYDNGKTYSGLTAFIGDYVEEVDRSWLPVAAEPFDVDETVADWLCRESWARHITQLRVQAATGAPPAHSWLDRFPTPSIRE